MTEYKRSLVRNLNRIIIEAEEIRNHVEDEIDFDPSDIYNRMVSLRELAYRADVGYQNMVALS